MGRSTLLRTLAAARDRDVVDLDDPVVRESVRLEPTVCAAGPRPVFLDEFQHVPEVLDAIKAELNWDGLPGRFAALRRKAGSLFAGGVLLCLGDRVVRAESDVLAVPIDRLWRAGASQDRPS